MPEEWFVRVLGKEYGPVDLETLREWQTDGHLIATNELRRATETEWVQAGTLLPELFAPPAPPPPPEPIAVQLERRRSFGQILADTCRLYARGFLTFVGLSALVGVPTLGFWVSLAFTNLRADAPLSGSGRIAAALAIIMGVLILVTKPLFIAGLQFATAELAAGRHVRFRDVLRRAVNFWPRIAQLCLITYSAFLFWGLMPLLVALGAVAQPTALSLVFAVLGLVVGVYMFGRLFVNFLFWQQTATIGGLHGLDALQQSKEVARAGRAAPWLDRPLYRGAILASLWLVLDFAVSVAVQLPFVIARLMPAQSFEQAIAIMRAQEPDALTVATYVVSVGVDTILRPLLGIAFVVLFFDAKTRV